MCHNYFPYSLTRGDAQQCTVSNLPATHQRQQSRILCDHGSYLVGGYTGDVVGKSNVGVDSPAEGVPVTCCYCCGLYRPSTGGLFDERGWLTRRSIDVEPKYVETVVVADIVPITLGKRLYALIQAPKRFASVAGGGHNDLGAKAVAAAKEFIAE